MADYPVEALGGKTPLEAAKKPCMDMLASKGVSGLVKTVPDDLAPGSDVANLSVMGYEPYIYYTGRSPLEALSMGINLGDDDTTFRANLVTLSDDDIYAEKTMVDYSADEISSEEAKILITDLNEALKNEFLTFFSGISYRHLLVWKGCDTQYKLTPPHDISGKKITNYLPDSPIVLHLMERSSEMLKKHPVNIKRREKGLNPANSLWIWGQGTKPKLSSFEEKFGLKGSVISAVDLIKGIGIGAGMQSIDVDGATGNIHTNFDGKAQAAIACLRNCDFIYVHIEAPDECGHRFETENKVRAIELIDEKIVRPIFEALTSEYPEFSIMILPDHPTPLLLGTHTHDPVPYVIYRGGDANGNPTYSEANANQGGLIEKGWTLMGKFLSK